MKSFKYFKIPSSDLKSGTGLNGHIYKHSIYLQSKDDDWLQRNSRLIADDDFPEPIEEDIRD